MIMIIIIIIIIIMIIYNNNNNNDNDNNNNNNNDYKTLFIYFFKNDIKNMFSFQYVLYVHDGLLYVALYIRVCDLYLYIGYK